MQWTSTVRRSRNVQLLIADIPIGPLLFIAGDIGRASTGEVRRLIRYVGPMMTSVTGDPWAAGQALPHFPVFHCGEGCGLVLPTQRLGGLRGVIMGEPLLHQAQHPRETVLQVA